MKRTFNLVRFSIAVALLSTMLAPPSAVVSETASETSAKPLRRLASRTASVAIDGRAQRLTFDLRAETTQHQRVIQSLGTGTCTAMTSTGDVVMYNCPGRDVSYTVVNHVTAVIPEAASRFGPLDELLELKQEEASIFVSAPRTSKKVLISASGRTDITNVDRVSKVVEAVTTLTIQFEDLATLIRPIAEGMEEIAVSEHYLSYRIGRVTDPSLLKFIVSVSVSGFLGPKEIPAHILEEDEFVIVDEGERFSRVVIDLNKLRLVPQLRGKTATFELITSLELPQAGLANRGDIPPSALVREWKTKFAKDWCLDLRS